MSVFISHSRQNASAALKLCNELNKRNVPTWLDVLDLESGVEWTAKVAEAIRASTALVFVLGPGNETDRGQQFELRQVVEEEFYLDSTRPLIPVVIGDAELPGFLSVRKAYPLDAASPDFAGAADFIAAALASPQDNVDEEKLQRGRDARAKAMKSFDEFVRDLGIDDAKLAALRALK